ncbi:MAG: hypothetical protein FWC92_04905 [Defluviitaleaceae bacterium]|nr:hypothetical protein [Defluviitaleaceae bacterium]
MPFTFILEKPSNINASFERLKTKLSAMGGRLTGNEKTGYITINGAEGQYNVEPEHIKVTITKKPAPIIPNVLIEKQVRSIFTEISC